MVPQPGQGTFTVATVRPDRARPLPSHFTVTLTGSSQAQQAKSRITCSSIINDGPQDNGDQDCRLPRKTSRASSLAFGDLCYLPSRLAPYFDRACLRSATPCASRTPRMM